MKKVALLFLSLFASTLFTGTASASLMTFNLMDSQHGDQAPPTYGLRLDGLYSGHARDIYTFSFVDVTMTVDTVAETANLSGSMLGGTQNEGQDRDTNWLLDFTYTGLDVDSDGSWEFDDNNSGGTGTIQIDAIGGDLFNLIQYMGSDGWGPKGSDVSCRQTDGPWCGNGWLNHSITPGDATPDWQHTHLAASDFLYKGAPVPAPATLGLLALGLIGLVGIKKRRA